MLGASTMAGIQFCGSRLPSSLDVAIEKAKADVEFAAGASDVIDDDGDPSFFLSLAAYLAERS